MRDDREAFTQFVREQSATLHRAAYALTGDGHLAQDLVQETLARLFEIWPRIELVNPGGYAHTTLVRTYLSMRRRRSFFERPISTPPDLPAPPEPDSLLRHTLHAALAELSATDRAVLVLRYICDLSVEQVAHDLGRSPTAIRSASKRALGRLKVLLEPDLFADLVVSA